MHCGPSSGDIRKIDTCGEGFDSPWVVANFAIRSGVSLSLRRLKERRRKSVKFGSEADKFLAFSAKSHWVHHIKLHTKSLLKEGFLLNQYWLRKIDTVFSIVNLEILFNLKHILALR